ncbi:MAG: [FeFe] hydrogenase H-cluster maturation GTPase HydF [Lachnospiraceae bacterium]|nr:[FeFe] hydrogenase H-cluster maturation GTPase HydF [Lachnospiraceae bacterium]
MGMNDTPSADRKHIGFFGCRNAGKSSIVNAVTGQELAVVSDVKGTTTDPVYKAMELLPMGPVMIIDTPGIDDTGALGELRVKKTRQILNRADLAVLVTDASRTLNPAEVELLDLFRKKEIPFVIVRNKADLPSALASDPGIPASDPVCTTSATLHTGIEELKETIAHLVRTEDEKLRIVGDLLHPGDMVVLVVPIDKAAPKGRLILPQQQTIRDVLEADAACVVVKEYELRDTLAQLKKKPAMVITDSQVFSKVVADTPPDVPLTSFSILMARYKGFLESAVHGAAAIDRLKPGDKILISEGCTHHRQCDDIGTVKIPRWLKNYLGFPIQIDSTSGRDFPDDLGEYSLVIHCGGCMLTEREVRYRMKCANDQEVPFTNYGITIAYIQGILKRSIEIFPYLLDEFVD